MLCWRPTAPASRRAPQGRLAGGVRARPCSGHSRYGIDNEQMLDADGLADRVASISYIASLPDDERAGVIAAARESSRRTVR